MRIGKYKLFVRKLEGMRLLGSSGCGSEDNIKFVLKKKGCENLN
jgi:hypothetical protein